MAKWILLMSLAGCQLIQRVRADKVVVLTWIQQPVIDVAPFNAMPENGAVTATAYFGHMTPTLQPEPISGAFAAFFGAGKKFEMTEQSEGLYAINSMTDDRLVYDTDENRRYGFKACTENRDGCIGEEYSLKRIRAAPIVDKTTIALDPALSPSNLPAFDGSLPTGTSLKITFPAPTDENRYRPIITVLGAGIGQPPGVIFNSIPTGGADLVKFILEEPPLEYTIPGDKLNAPGLYAVLVASARLNLDTTDNLFLGSGAIAGASSAFLIEVTGDPIEIPGGLMLPDLPLP